MKHITFLHDNESIEYKKAKKVAKKSIYKSQLIQIFTALTSKKEIRKLLHDIHKNFPDAKIIGTTTAGEISHAKMHDNSTVISLSLFEKTKLKTYQVNNIDKTSGNLLSSQICSKQTKAAIVLSEGLNGEDYEGFIKGIKQENPNLIIAGGLAGDNFALKKTFVFLGTKIYEEGAVAVSFSGKKLFANNNYNLNWIPIGKEFTITSADKNIIKEINSQSAVSVFKKYLGSQILDNNAASLPDFQLLYKEGNTVVSRTPMAVEGDALVFAGPLKEGQKVQFGFSNASSVISGSNIIGQTLKQKPAEAIFIYSCIARKTLLGKVLENEFKPFESLAPTAGFFTYGEFYSTTGDNALLNCTTTILVLSEKQKHKQKIQTQEVNTNSLDNVTFNALTHFVKQTSEELKENIHLLQEYKDVVDESSLVSKADTKGIITYANDNFCNVSKYSRQELIGHNHNIIRDANVSDFIFKKMWLTILSGKTWKGLLSNRAKDGSIYFVDSTIMPIFDEDGQIHEFIAIRQDVTKQVESKKRIQEKEKLIKAIFDNQDSIVLLSSKEKGMLNANKKLFHYLDYESFEEFKSQHDCICNLFIEEEGYIYPSKYPNWIDDTANNKTDKDKKAKILTKDGIVRTFNIMVKQIDDAYIINLYDITTLENAILKAHASEQAKSTFLANMSHEIRTPLNGILGFTDILTNRNLDNEAKRYVDIIHKSGETLLNVVNDILDYSKLESGELSLHEVQTNLFSEMEAAVSTFSSLCKTKQINYYTYIDSEIPISLKCDIQRLKQVINNLISNAVKFTPASGEIRVNIKLNKIKNKHANLHFSIKDSGIGISDEKIETIFDAFSQADSSISREFGGTGLGLSISNQYIHMMGSKIRVKSKPKKGSEFYFDINLPILNSAQSIQSNASTPQMNIAVLKSDSQMNCAINEIVYTYLNSWNYHYKEITSLDELNKDTQILIVCAKLFEQDSCLKALNSSEKLHLIYIEGAEETFNCTHEKFHLIEQPLTGSMLFDKLITLSNTNLNPEYTHQKEKQSAIQYHGNILIAEDNETNQMLIGIMLQERGLKYTIVNNGQEAVEEATRKYYDIILMDINMPIMDGITATKILRKKNYDKTIVSLSANVIESDIKTFLRAGVNDTLNKPIIAEELDTLLAKFLNLQSEEEVKTEVSNFDTVNLDLIGKSLGIEDQNIILSLLSSFIETLQEILLKIQSDRLNKNILHNLKGVTGNLRFNNIYKLSMQYENEIDEWDEDLLQKHENIILLHIKEIIRQIEKINQQ